MEDQKKTVLVAEDEEGIREFIREVLQDEGFEVLVARDGAEAMAMALSSEKIPHLIISDIQMPKKDGIIFLKEIKAIPKFARVPFVLLTALREKTGISLTKEGIGNALGVEPSAYLEKPISAQDLLKMVRSVV